MNAPHARQWDELEVGVPAPVHAAPGGCPEGPQGPIRLPESGHVPDLPGG